MLRPLRGMATAEGSKRPKKLWGREGAAATRASAEQRGPGTPDPGRSPPSLQRHLWAELSRTSARGDGAGGSALGPGEWIPEGESAGKTHENDQNGRERTELCGQIPQETDRIRARRPHPSLRDLNAVQ